MAFIYEGKGDDDEEARGLIVSVKVCLSMLLSSHDKLTGDRTQSFNHSSRSFLRLHDAHTSLPSSSSRPASYCWASQSQRILCSTGRTFRP